MGLDQYAGFRDSKGEVHDTFYWRKHSRLQVFFAGEYIEQNKAHTQKLENNTIDDLQHLGFNAGQGGVKITEELVNRLDKERKEGYPNCVAEDGFFWGQQFQKDAVKEYKEQDMKFLKFCEQAISENKVVEYWCSW